MKSVTYFLNHREMSEHGSAFGLVILHTGNNCICDSSTVFIRCGECYFTNETISFFCSSLVVFQLSMTGYWMARVPLVRYNFNVNYNYVLLGVHVDNVSQ